MINRDSLVLILGIVAGLIMYLIGTKPVYEWSYYEWLAAAGYAVSVVSAKLSTSALAGAGDKLKDTKSVLGVFSVKEK